MKAEANAKCPTTPVARAQCLEIEQPEAPDPYTDPANIVYAPRVDLAAKVEAKQMMISGNVGGTPVSAMATTTGAAYIPLSGSTFSRGGRAAPVGLPSTGRITGNNLTADAWAPPDTPCFSA